jgi:hypothetical protein
VPVNNKASFFSAFLILFALLLFPLTPTPAFQQLDAMDEGEMKRAGAGHMLMFTLAAQENRPLTRIVDRTENKAVGFGVNRPVTRVVQPEENHAAAWGFQTSRENSAGLRALAVGDMNAITGGNASNSVKVVINELYGEIYYRGCQFQVVPESWEEKPELEFLRNWRLMKHFAVHRGYLDVGFENYGWALEHQNPGDNYYSELDSKFSWHDGTPLQVDTVLFLTRMLPGRLYVAEKEYFNARVLIDAGCRYERGYFVFFDNDFLDID